MPRAQLPEPPDRDGPAGPADGEDLSSTLAAVGRAAGLHSIGVTTAEVFEETRAHLLERRRQGLHATMQFTYRNPERSTDPTRILPGARSLVVGAWSYRQSDPDPDPEPDPPRPDAEARPQGSVARYARFDHYTALRQALTPIAAHLHGLGWRARVILDDNALVDRAAAHRAGLGWFGKNSLLLIPEAGSWFVLGSVVTDAPLRPTLAAPPAVHAVGCGSCTRCMTACPTGALVSPGVVDARRCLAWLVQAPGSFPEEYREALGNRIYGCDECQQVCPINKVADRRDPPPPGVPPHLTDGHTGGHGTDGHTTSGHTDGPQVDLLDLLEATDEELLLARRRWYIADRDPRYLRRNALVALGNVGDGRNPATEVVLRHWLAAEDPLLAEHARWAASRLGRADLVATDPDVLPDAATL